MITNIPLTRKRVSLCFFLSPHAGSSTDISPSVIEYYDRLSQNINQQQQPQPQTRPVSTCPSITTTTSITTAAVTAAAATTAISQTISAPRDDIVRGAQSVQQQPQPQTQFPSRDNAANSNRTQFARNSSQQTARRPNGGGGSGAVAGAPVVPTADHHPRHHPRLPLQSSASPKKLFNVLSHNVARMIAHSSCESIDDEPTTGAAAPSSPLTVISAPHALQQQQQHQPTPPPSLPPPLVKRHHLHHTNLPLSRNTSKLTQLNGADVMVGAYESATTMPSAAQPSQSSSLSSLTTHGLSSSTDSIVQSTASAATIGVDVVVAAVGKDAKTCSGYFGSDDAAVVSSDSDRTPTNGSDTAATASRFTFNAMAANRLKTEVPKNGDHHDDDGDNDDDDDESSDEHYEDCISEAINFMVQVPAPLQPLKVRAQRKLCTIQERKNMLFDRPTAATGTAAASASLKTAASVGSPTGTSDTSPKLGAVRSVRKVTPPPVLVMPDLARLKHHRPLSASSISSTTSSSSSGSEHNHHHLGHHHISLLNGSGNGGIGGISSGGGVGGGVGGGGNKLLNVAYLASVESLADQSESEPASSTSAPGAGAGIGVGAQMTMCERACREIVDSERSYVEDLGQVIKG